MFVYTDTFSQELVISQAFRSYDQQNPGGIDAGIDVKKHGPLLMGDDSHAAGKRGTYAQSPKPRYWWTTSIT